MIEPELPLLLTFKGKNGAFNFIQALDEALEQVIWEQRVAEDGSVIVTILNIINLEEKVEQNE